tara:strand:+ start:91 stop:270 length:180 start_codon:yes stop_codon:yes gene_type:complete
MSAVDILQSALGLATVAGIGGLWFRLGQALESNAQTHTRLNGLTTRVRDLEIKAWSTKT